MTMVLCLGPEVYFYNWRFVRSPQNGKLTLR